MTHKILTIVDKEKEIYNNKRINNNYKREDQYPQIRVLEIRVLTKLYKKLQKKPLLLVILVRLDN